MTKAKKWYESKTIIAGIVAMLNMVFMVAEVDLDEGVITELVNGVVAVVAIAATIYGRIVAEKNITL